MAKRKSHTKPKVTKTRKKKKSNSKNNNTQNSILIYLNKAILFLIIFIIVFFVYTIFIKDDITEISNELQKTKSTTQIKHKKTIKELSKEFEEKTKELTVEYVDNDEESIITNKKPFDLEKKHNPIFTKEELDKITIDEIKINQPKKEEKEKIEEEIIINKAGDNKKTIKKELHTKEKTKYIEPTINHNKAMLAIVIDDISNNSQVRKIQAIPYPVTMAFLPPTSKHKNSAKIAQNIKVHMIHLPLEAGNRRYEETNTLHIGDSLDKIDARIKQLRQWYPNTIYTNNHTGSKFTADDESMDKLIKSLKKYGFYFIDSRTTAKTVIKKYAKKYNLKYMSRNVFIDNKAEKQYIIKQLKSAIKIAKKKGFAIAIGHPHSMTLQTLKEVKYLFKGIQLVNINTLAHNK